MRLVSLRGGERGIKLKAMHLKLVKGGERHLLYVRVKLYETNAGTMTCNSASIDTVASITLIFQFFFFLEGKILTINMIFLFL